MRWIDLLRFPLVSLGQHKVRTSLTTLGVVFGAFVLAASLAIDEGVQRTIDRESNKGDVARKVTAFPGRRPAGGAADEDVKVEGRASPQRRERIRKVLVQKRRLGAVQEPVNLTRERLDALARIPHVRLVVPIVGGRAVATLGNRPEEASVSCGAGEDPEFPVRIVLGRTFESDDERAVLISEMFAYRIGLVDDADLEQAVGKPLRIAMQGRQEGEGPSFNVRLADRSRVGRGGVNGNGNGNGNGREEQSALLQLAWQLPGALGAFSLTDDERAALESAIRREPAESRSDPVVEDFRIVGVFRDPTDEEKKEAWSRFPADTDLVLPRRTAVDLAFRDAAYREQGAAEAVLFVDEVADVKPVEARIQALGLQTRSAHDFIERQRLTYLLVFGGMTCVAAVALLVASLGIANTMLMSVLERRREIGVMKAVGATNGQLQTLFVIEGALIGLVGGSLGMLLAWSASFPGDAWVRSMVQRDMNIDLSESIFAFPGWIAATVVCVTVGVTIVAALYPARRAAVVDPVTALRHD